MVEFLVTALGFVLFFIALIVLVGFIRIWFARRRLHRRLSALGLSDAVATTLVAVASLGTDHRPTSGTLAWNQEMVGYLPFAGSPDFLIERKVITSVSAQNQFMNLSYHKPLLVITFEHQGMGDAAAFAVADTQGWVDRLSGHES